MTSTVAFWDRQEHRGSARGLEAGAVSDVQQLSVNSLGGFPAVRGVVILRVWPLKFRGWRGDDYF